MMKYLSVVFLCVFASVVSAQNEADVLRYSSETLGSSARSFGVAGAFGAIGADPSSASINPSGIARYRTSNFVMSMGFYNAKTTAHYINKDLVENKFNFNIPNLGLIVNIRGEDYESKNPQGFVNFVLGFNMNRINNFHKRSIFDANNTTSITQEWAERASKTESVPADFSQYSLEHLAYGAWLIDKDTASQIPRYVSAYGNNAIDVRQRGIILSRGAINDYSFSFGGNYKHILLFGVALGAKRVRFIQNNNFTETDNKKLNIQDIKSVTFDQYLRTTGTGFNAKIGATLTPLEFLRIGYALHTPTVYNLTDSYSYTVTSAFDQGARDPNFGDLRVPGTLSTDVTLYKYKITTPARHVLSLALVNKEAGFISMDLETVNYASANMQPKDPKEEPFLQENLNIKNNFRRTYNLRIGGEVIYEQYRFRAGYARYPSPYKEGVVPFINHLTNNVYTLGFGIKTSAYSIDFAYVNSGYADYTVPYSLSKLPPNTSNYTITNNVRAVNFVVTAGFKLD